MGIIEILVLGIGVSLDAFAVSVSGAISDREHPLVHATIACFMFGFFQFVMPIIGGFVGGFAQGYIESFDHYVAFILLLVVGGKMVYEAFKNADEAEAKKCKSPFDFPVILILAIATSLDAMAVGVSLKLIGVPVLLPSIVMGIATGIFSFSGVMLGSLLGKIEKAEKYLTVIGGVAIILIGLKIFISHI